MHPGDHRDKQSRFNNTLIACDRALKECAMEYFLASGTALGAVREKNFIPYTNDIDIGFFAGQDIANLVHSMDRHGLDFIQAFGAPNDAFKVKFWHREYSVRVDVFSYYEDPDYYWHATYGRTCRCMARGYCRWRFKKFGLGEITFLGNRYLIPDPPEQYFQDKYGGDWRTPKDYSHRQGIWGQYKNLVFEPSLFNASKMIWDQFLYSMRLKQ